MLEPRSVVAALEARRGAPRSEAYALAIAEHLIRHAGAIGLAGLEDTLDVLAVWLDLTEAAPGSVYVEGMLRVVLSARSWPLAARIAFLQRHLAGRAPTPVDEADARVLFGMGGTAS